MATKKVTQEAYRRRRNRRRIAICGTVIIVFTFIARDIVRDNARDSLTAVQGAQVSYLAGSFQSFTMIRVVDLTRDLVAFMHEYEHDAETKHIPIFTDPLNPRPGFLEIEDSVILADGLVIQNVESLLWWLPQDLPPDARPEAKEYAIVKARFWKLKERAAKQMETFKSSGQTYATPEQVAEIIGIEKEADDLRGEALAMSGRVFSRSVQLSGSLEDSYKKKNYFFYGFFVLGVLVNLWGTLAGVDIEEGP